jgi:hypothetical protein
LMMIEALRRELGFKPKPGFALILPVTVWVMVLHGLHETGHMKQVGVLIYSCAFICLNLVLSGLVWQLRRIHRSRSLRWRDRRCLSWGLAEQVGDCSWLVQQESRSCQRAQS